MVEAACNEPSFCDGWFVLVSCADLVKLVQPVVESDVVPLSTLPGNEIQMIGAAFFRHLDILAQVLRAKYKLPNS